MHLKSLRSVAIRSRVSLAILALSSTALGIMSLGVFISFETRLRANFDDTLRTRAASNFTLIDASSGVIALRSAPDPGNERTNGVSLIRLYGTDGTLVADGSSAVGISAMESVLAQQVGRTGTERLATLEDAGAEQFRVVVSPVREAGLVRGVLLTGLETAQIEEPLTILRVILFVAVPATSLVLAVGAFFIARQALLPIAAITASANRIAHGDLRERITGIDSRDEVGELATTFNQMIERIEGTVERERRFTADASHELRTPLAALETSIDVTLSQRRRPEDYERTLTAMRTQTGRLSALMRQLLVLSRVDTSSVASNFENLNVAAVLSAVSESFRESHPGVTLETRGLEEALPLSGDFELLIRLFGNVLENAVVHGTPEARITVTLSREPGAARIVIHDDGPGMSEEIRNRAFQRFSRGDAARTRGGSGLGLAVVESIARAHGGGARILPGGLGTTIEITLPVPA